MDVQQRRVPLHHPVQPAERGVEERQEPFGEVVGGGVLAVRRGQQVRARRPWEVQPYPADDRRGGTVAGQPQPYVQVAAGRLVHQEVERAGWRLLPVARAGYDRLLGGRDRDPQRRHDEHADEKTSQ